MKINRKNVLFMIGCINSNFSLISDYFNSTKNKDSARRDFVQMKYNISKLDPFIITLLKYITNSQNISKLRVFKICKEIIFESTSYEIEERTHMRSFIVMKSKIYSNENLRGGNRNGVEYDVNTFNSPQGNSQVTELIDDKFTSDLFREVCEIFMDTKNGLSVLIASNRNEIRKNNLHEIYKVNSNG